MSSTYGYGHKTFVQGLARLACRVAKYLVKYDKQLKAFLPPAVYSCATGAVSCLNSICELLNKSAA